jgi:hypothetical protein
MRTIMLDRYVAIFRLKQGVGNRQSYSTVTTTLEATIQPLGQTGQAGGSYGKLYKIYLDETYDIQQGDKIKDKDGNEYKIVEGGIDKRTETGVCDYTGVTVQRINK